MLAVNIVMQTYLACHAGCTMSYDILLQLHSIYYIGYFVAFIVLITKGEKISAYFEKRHGKLEKAEIRKADGAKTSRFEP